MCEIGSFWIENILTKFSIVKWSLLTTQYIWFNHFLLFCYSGKGRGFAFIRFFEKADQEDCIDAVKKEPVHFGGPDCRVDFAKQKPRPGTYDRGLLGQSVARTAA